MYNTHMENTYLYIRFSHEKQDKGSSRDRQLLLAKAYCSTLIEDKAHIYFDSGKSAFSGANTADGSELKRFTDAVRSGAVPKGSTLLVEDLDRLSRADMWDASDQFRDLLARGITIVTTRDGRSYKDSLPIADALTTLIKQDLANKESAGKSDRVGKSYVTRYAQARAGIKVKVLLPSWLEWTSPTTPYKVKEAEAATVVEIFEMAAAGKSYAVIAKELNQRGVKPFRGKKEGKLWITASLFALVKSTAVLGTYSPNDGGPPIPDYFPAIVDNALFEAAQGARAERKRDKVTTSADKVNVWGKVGVCGWCKRPMHCLPKGRMQQRYLVCSGKAGGKCEAKNVSAAASEAVFLEVVLNAVNADYFETDRRQEQQEIRTLAGQIDAVQVRRAKLVALLDTDPMPEVVVAMKRAKAEIDTLEAAKLEIEQRVAGGSSLERSRAALMAKIDLVSPEGRTEANMLLRRLKIKVEIVRGEGRVTYSVRQDGDKVLYVLHRAGEEVPVTVPYSQATAERMHERGELEELGYNVSLNDLIARKSSGS